MLPTFYLQQCLLKARMVQELGRNVASSEGPSYDTRSLGRVRLWKGTAVR
jgi:hypothetical protein